MNTNALIYFLAACETRSFSKAAEKCYLSPQGVSKTIRKLEEELGRQLFRRTPQGMELTEYGAALRLRAERIVKETQLLQEDFERLAEGEGRRVCLGVAMGVPQVMGRDFCAQIQELLLREGLTSVDSVDLMCESEVAGRRYELAITAGPVDSGRFESVTLRKGCLCAFVHASHPFYREEYITFEALRGQQLITTNQNYRTYHQLTAACRHYGFEPDIIATTITIRDTCRAAPYRSAVGVSSHLILGKVSFADFRAIPIRDESFGWDMVLISKKGSRLSSKLTRIYQGILHYAGVQA